MGMIPERTSFTAARVPAEMGLMIDMVFLVLIVSELQELDAW